MLSPLQLSFLRANRIVAWRRQREIVQATFPEREIAEKKVLTQNAGTEVLPDFHWHRRIATINTKEELLTSQPVSGLLSLKVGAGMPAIGPRREL